LTFTFQSTVQWRRAQIKKRGSAPPTPLLAANGAVAADNPVCSQVGVEILKEGGNAIDAAISTGLCQGVLNPFASGIGGGGVMMIHLANNTQILWDFREMAPATAYKEMYVSNPGLSLNGGLAVAVPGELKGMALMFQLYGSGNVSWYRLFEPAINFTRYGYPVQKLLAQRIQETRNAILNYPGLKSIFTNNNGELLQEGNLYKNPNLANTLELVATQGVDAFYNGTLTQTMVDEINAAGGNISVNDFQNYTPVQREIIPWYWLGYKFLGAYPPYSGGAVMGLTFNILELYNFATLGYNANTLHLMIESWKFGFADRMTLGDPNFVNVSQNVEIMIDKDHASYLRPKITPGITHSPPYYRDLAIGESIFDSGTTHISVVDVDRNAVAFTTTINTGFGSKILGLNSGVLFNNEMDDFSSPNSSNYWDFPPATANFIVPWKRPLSSMSPTIIYKNEKPYIITGASGGSRIITAVQQVIFNIISFGLNIKAAIDKPRMHCQLIPPTVQVEVDFPATYVNELKTFGHNFSTISEAANVQAILIDDSNMLYAASDKRKLGAPAGY